LSSALERVKDERFVYLTTKGRRTGRPHTVELWFALAGGKVYLSHEGGRTDWMKNLAREGAATMRIGGVTFGASARVAEGAARELGERALYEKYYGGASKEVVDDWFDLSVVLELTPSSAPPRRGTAGSPPDGRAGADD
jgi:deazaflavin-dependent oxidoreductase (nitroreductase family)